jgi:hypothetical protein
MLDVTRSTSCKNVAAKVNDTADAAIGTRGKPRTLLLSSNRRDRSNLPLNSLQIISPPLSDPWIRSQLLIESAQRVSSRIESFIAVPRLESIFDVREPRLAELRIVSKENRPEIRVIDPIQSFPTVGFLIVAGGVEAVGLQSTGGV